MSEFNINEVRERLEVIASEAATYGDGDDLRAILADHARLRAQATDLEQFREAVLVARSYYEEMAGDIHDTHHNDVADCDRLLSLIDGQPTKGEAARC